MVKSISPRELYNSQTTAYLEKKRNELDKELSVKFNWTINSTKQVIDQILEERSSFEQDDWKEEQANKICWGACDGSCGILCKNRI